MAIQDIGNGVGIAHKTEQLGDVQLGDVLKIVYPTAKSIPRVEHLPNSDYASVPAAQSALSDRLAASLNAMDNKLRDEYLENTASNQGQLQL